MKKEQKKKTGEDRLDMLVNLVWHDPALWYSISKSDWYDRERLEVLYYIVQSMVQRRMGGLESQIYQYGSMIKNEDFVARQVFVWLLQLTETMPGKEKE